MTIMNLEHMCRVQKEKDIEEFEEICGVRV
jgi:hypothetical protein